MLTFCEKFPDECNARWKVEINVNRNTKSGSSTVVSNPKELIKVCPFLINVEQYNDQLIQENNLGGFLLAKHIFEKV
jgi:hypothetical protein